jgi:hypothetical protein
MESQVKQRILEATSKWARATHVLKIQHVLLKSKWWWVVIILFNKTLSKKFISLTNFNLDTHILIIFSEDLFWTRASLSYDWYTRYYLDSVQISQYM